MIKFAIIGCGHIGKRHAEMIDRNPEAELVGLCDIKPKNELALEKWNHLPFFSSAYDMMNSKIDADVITIATPNGLHFEFAQLSLQNGYNVVVEKPMALNKADCETLIYEALNKHKRIFGVMQNRYSPPSVWMKELINSNILGNIFMVQINCYWNRDDRYYKKEGWKGDKELDGGTLFTQFSHFLDIMYWIFGDIKNIKGNFTNNNHKHSIDFEDSGFVNFEFVNGGLGCLNYSTSVWDTNLESSITVIAENGSFKIGGQYMNEVEYCHIKDYEMPILPPANPANDYGAYKGSAANHNFVIDNVVNTLKKSDSVSTNALEGLKIVDIIERIYSIRDQEFSHKKRNSLIEFN